MYIHSYIYFLGMPFKSYAKGDIFYMSEGLNVLLLTRQTGPQVIKIYAAYSNSVIMHVLSLLLVLVFCFFFVLARTTKSLEKCDKAPQEIFQMLWKKPLMLDITHGGRGGGGGVRQLDSSPRNPVLSVRVWICLLLLLLVFFYPARNFKTWRRRGSRGWECA